MATRTAADFICVPVRMNRADDRGSRATTRVQPAPRVTLNWQATPFTCGRREEKKWIREKSGRRVLHTSTGRGKVNYWRAPRPRPRLHRRRRRQCKTQVLNKTMSQEKIVPESLTEAQVAIQVLQAALRASLLREQKLGEQLRVQIEKTSSMVPAQSGDETLPKSDAAESGFTGVTRNKSGWAAHTERQQGTRVHLGTFDTPVEAARARRDHISDVVAALQFPQDRAMKIKHHVVAMRECRCKYVELYGKPSWAQEYWYQWGRPHSAARLYNICSEHVDCNNTRLRAMTAFKHNYCKSWAVHHVAAINSQPGPQWHLPSSMTFEWLIVPMGILSICYLISLFTFGP